MVVAVVVVACITSCSLGSASSRLGIDRLCPRGPHGDSAFVQTRASPSALALNMAPVGGHVASPPPHGYRTTTDAAWTVSAHSTTARDIWCSHESLSPSLFPPFSPSPSPSLSLHSRLASPHRSLFLSLPLCPSTSLIPTGSVSISSCILLFRDGLNICTAR